MKSIHHPLTPLHSKVQGPTSAQQNNATSASAQQKDSTSAQAHNNIVLQRLDEMGKF